MLHFFFFIFLETEISQDSQNILAFNDYMCVYLLLLETFACCTPKLGKSIFSIQSKSDARLHEFEIKTLFSLWDQSDWKRENLRFTYEIVYCDCPKKTTRRVRHSVASEIQMNSRVNVTRLYRNNITDYRGITTLETRNLLSLSQELTISRYKLSADDYSCLLNVVTRARANIGERAVFSYYKESTFEEDKLSHESDAKQWYKYLGESIAKILMDSRWFDVTIGRF